ncbi:uncharacterized protein LOC141574809 [Camelus bactrianus]|uniref:Uncharacterized protein LOC141574809 n=1 Tax=Camelus bactrianus TaxID=9837 RepID=A0AC58PDU8_CAMBA
MTKWGREGLAGPCRQSPAGRAATQVENELFTPVPSPCSWSAPGKLAWSWGRWRGGPSRPPRAERLALGKALVCPCAGSSVCSLSGRRTLGFLHLETAAATCGVRVLAPCPPVRPRLQAGPRGLGGACGAVLLSGHPVEGRVPGADSCCVGFRLLSVLALLSVIQPSSPFCPAGHPVGRRAPTFPRTSPRGLPRERPVVVQRATCTWAPLEPCAASPPTASCSARTVCQLKGPLSCGNDVFREDVRGALWPNVSLLQPAPSAVLSYCHP